jgi:hypothetical protein
MRLDMHILTTYLTAIREDREIGIRNGKDGIK